MDTFQKIVLGISVFLLILILIIFVIMVRYNKTSYVFPPIQQDCPEGWAADSSGNCYFKGKNGGSLVLPDGNLTDTGNKVASQFPIYPATNNNGNITFNSNANPFGTISTAPLDASVSKTIIFNSKDSAWSSNGGQSICGKQKFANQYSIYWDGVSNTNQCSTTAKK